jgi:uncharacterized protein (DUF2249 family)
MNELHGSTCTTLTAADTVRDASRSPAALQALQRLGVNHCCGAHLTLAEAAAASGVTVDELLAAVNEGPAGSRTVAIDVRGLEPPQPMVRVLETLDQLGSDDVLEVHHDRRPIFLYPQLEARGFTHETDEPQPGLVRIRIRHGRAS